MQSFDDANLALVQETAAMRTLLTLSPIPESASTAQTLPELPPLKTVTGDPKVDAVLWLREVIKTGSNSLIDRAIEAAKQIKTPPKEVRERSGRLVVRPGEHELELELIGCCGGAGPTMTHARIPLVVAPRAGAPPAPQAAPK
jgi:hypothetical protein